MGANTTVRRESYLVCIATMDLLLADKALNHVINKFLGDLAVIDSDTIIGVLDDNGLGVDRVRDLLDDLVGGNCLLKGHPGDGLVAVVQLELGVLVVGRKLEHNSKVLGSLFVAGEGVLADSTTIVSLGVLWVDLHCLVSITNPDQDQQKREQMSALVLIMIFLWLNELLSVECR